MAIIEINLEKPALVEERQRRGASSERSASGRKRSGSGRGGGRGKLLGLLAVLAGLGIVLARMRGGGETEMDVGMEAHSMDEMDDADAESASGGMRRFAGALGLAVALASVAVAVLKRRR